jgi:hypothetical protein
MSGSVPIGERPSASRIDDLGSPHIPVSPELGLFEGDDTRVQPAGPPPAAAHLRSHPAMR